MPPQNLSKTPQNQPFFYAVKLDCQGELTPKTNAQSRLGPLPKCPPKTS